jgi:hypothetical protein
MISIKLEMKEQQKILSFWITLSHSRYKIYCKSLTRQELLKRRNDFFSFMIYKVLFDNKPVEICIVL